MAFLDELFHGRPVELPDGTVIDGGPEPEPLTEGERELWAAALATAAAGGDDELVARLRGMADDPAAVRSALADAGQPPAEPPRGNDDSAG